MAPAQPRSARPDRRREPAAPRQVLLGRHDRRQRQHPADAAGADDEHRRISAQQQPTQKRPWSMPIRNASRGGDRPCQRAFTKPKGVRHRSRQRYLSALHWKRPAPVSTAAPTSPAVGDEPRGAAGGPAQRRVGGVGDDPEGEPRDDEAGDDEREEPSPHRGGRRDPPDHGQQRKRRRQHHRGDHQHPRERVQKRRHEIVALRNRATERRERAVIDPSRRVRDSGAYGLVLHTHSAAHEATISSAEERDERRLSLAGVRGPRRAPAQPSVARWPCRTRRAPVERDGRRGASPVRTGTRTCSGARCDP